MIPARPHILVTNDDGIESPGIWALAAALHAADLGDVTIIAPNEERSGAGMSIPPTPHGEIVPATAPSPEVAHIPAWATTATPAACLTLAMLDIVCPRPDIVVSGINLGLNTGGNVMVSGTVGAAMAGALWGIPGLALSVELVHGEPLAWETAAWAAVTLFPLVRRAAVPEGHRPLVLNVNVPHAPEGPTTLHGFRQTLLSEFFYGTTVTIAEVVAHEDAGHRYRFSFDPSRRPSRLDPETDLGAVRAGYVSVTPLAPMTVHPHIDLGRALAAL